MLDQQNIKCEPLDVNPYNFDGFNQYLDDRSITGFAKEFALNNFVCCQLRELERIRTDIEKETSRLKKKKESLARIQQRICYLSSKAERKERKIEACAKEIDGWRSSLKETKKELEKTEKYLWAVKEYEKDKDGLVAYLQQYEEEEVCKSQNALKNEVQEFVTAKKASIEDLYKIVEELKQGFKSLKPKPDGTKPVAGDFPKYKELIPQMKAYVNDIVQWMQTHFQGITN